MAVQTGNTEERNVGRLPSSRFEWFNRRRLFLITMAVAALVYAQFQFWQRPARGDRANWDYFAQIISRGGVPYRDVVNIKSPLSAYIGAAAIVTMRPFGLRDIFAIRLTFLFLAVLTVGLTFLVAFDYFGRRRVGLLAAAIMIGVNFFATTNSGGVEPKTPMVMFGLLTLWAVHKGNSFWAGGFGMLSAMSWQPGLLFVGTAGLAFSSYLTKWRDWQVVRLLAGAAIPLVVLLAYFWMEGALRDFYLWGVHYNLNVYGPRGARPALSSIALIQSLLQSTFRRDRVFFYLAGVGIIVALFAELKRGRRDGAHSLLAAAPRHAIVIAPSVYLLFCLVNIQGSADLIPLVPFVGVFAALALVLAADQVIELFGKAETKLNRVAVERAGYVGLFLVVFYWGVSDAFAWKQGFPTLKDQDEAVAEIKAQMEAGDKIFVHGRTEILVLSGLTNASKYFFLDFGKDVYLNNVEPGGFDGWFERLKAERPRVVALSRLRQVQRKQEFRNWMDAEYHLRQDRVFSYYLRKADRD
jgi:hypothetical protein